MKKSFFAILILVTLCCNAFSATAKTNKYEIKIGDFNKIKVYDNIDVIWQCNPDSTGYAVFTCESDVSDAILFENNNKGTLKIQVTSEYENNPKLPTIRVYSDFLNQAQNDSESTLTVISPTPSAEFKAEIVGNGTIKVTGLNNTEVVGKVNTGKGKIIFTGTCTTANLNMIGAGIIDAEGLASTNVKCKLLGAGEIYCSPKDVLNVNGIGSTKIYYKTSPEEIKKHGGGKLIPLK
jgi:hypothetical protein